MPGPGSGAEELRTDTIIITELSRSNCITGPRIYAHQRHLSPCLALGVSSASPGHSATINSASGINIIKRYFARKGEHEHCHIGCVMQKHRPGVTACWWWSWCVSIGSIDTCVYAPAPLRWLRCGRVPARGVCCRWLAPVPPGDRSMQHAVWAVSCSHAVMQWHAGTLRWLKMM